MRIIIRDRTETLYERLRERLDRAALLRCDEHGEPVIAVTINVNENGWFDSMWITCCESLMQQATSIVKERC